MSKEIPERFPAIIYEELTPTPNPKVSTARVRTFYKYANRNMSFFTDDVANRLIEKAALTPIIGKYNVVKQDFEGHSQPHEVKMYGLIPENTGFAWESHLDEDGVAHDYACFDIILFTEYFEEAKQIIGKAQSMELKRESITGEWKKQNNKEYFVYDSAELKGLCILGEGVKPCFPSAGIYSLEQDTSLFQFMCTFFETLKHQAETEPELKVFLPEDLTKYEELGGDKPMIINGLNREDFNEMFLHFNPQFNEEGKFTITEMPIEVDDNNIITYSFEDKLLRSYSMIVEDGKPAVFSLALEGGIVLTSDHAEALAKYELSEDARAALQIQLDTVTAEFEEWKTKSAETITRNQESTGPDGQSYETSETITRITETVETYAAQISDLQTENQKLKDQISSYQAIEAEANETKKNNLFESFKEVLSSEEITPIMNERQNFSYEELEQQLAVVFAHKQLKPRTPEVRIPLVNPDAGQKDKLTKLLETYSRN